MGRSASKTIAVDDLQYADQMENLWRKTTVGGEELISSDVLRWVGDVRRARMAWVEDALSTGMKRKNIDKLRQEYVSWRSRVNLAEDVRIQGQTAVLDKIKVILYPTLEQLQQQSNFELPLELQDDPERVEILDSLLAGYALAGSSIARRAISDMAVLALTNKTLDSESWRVFLASVVVRQVLGNAPYILDENLISASRDYAKDMVEGEFFSPISPVPEKRTALMRARRFGATCDNELLSNSHATGKVQFDAWMNDWDSALLWCSSSTRRVGLWQHQGTWVVMFSR